MEARELYTITLGKYSDKYMVTTATTIGMTQLRRIRTPKTKIDAVRLPEHISIVFFGSQVAQGPIKKSKK